MPSLAGARLVAFPRSGGQSRELARALEQARTKHLPNKLLHELACATHNECPSVCWRRRTAPVRLRLRPNHATNAHTFVAILLECNRLRNVCVCVRTFMRAHLCESVC